MDGFLVQRLRKNKIEGQDEAARRAASLPILLCHGKDIYKHLHYVNYHGFTLDHVVRDGVGLLALSCITGKEVVPRPLTPFILIMN